MSSSRFTSKKFGPFCFELVKFGVCLNKEFLSLGVCFNIEFLYLGFQLGFLDFKWYDEPEDIADD